MVDEHENLARVVIEDGRPARRRLRRWTAALLVVLTCVCATAAVTGAWARRNVLDTEVFVERVAPLVRDVQMQEALTRVLSDRSIQAVDPGRLVSEALPERGQILVAPISAAVETFIRNLVERFVTSEQFDRLWAATVQYSHQAAVKVLRGEESRFASTAGGEVVLNLVPIIDALLAEVGKLSPEILGRNVTLPTLTVEEAPEAAVRRLESALGVHLEDGYGQIVVFRSDELSSVQNTVRWLDKGTVLLIGFTLILLPLSLWVSPRRRRTLLQLCAGLAIGFVLVRRTSYYVESQVVDAVDPSDHLVLRLVLDTFLNPLRSATLWVLAALALAALLAVLSGPYPCAVRTRAAVVQSSRRLASFTRQGAQGVTDPRTVAWLQAYKDTVRIVEAAVLLVALLFLSLPWPVIFVLFAAVVGVEVLLARTRADEGVDVATPPPFPTPPPPRT